VYLKRSECPVSFKVLIIAVIAVNVILARWIFYVAFKMTQGLTSICGLVTSDKWTQNVTAKLYIFGKILYFYTSYICTLSPVAKNVVIHHMCCFSCIYFPYTEFYSKSSSVCYNILSQFIAKSFFLIFSIPSRLLLFWGYYRLSERASDSWCK